MDNIIWFALEGESVDGEYLVFEKGIENATDFNDALDIIINEATNILNEVGGGHIDIFDNETHEFIIDVEV